MGGRLITPAPPPYAVRGHGRLPVEEAIGLYLEPVLARTARLDIPLDQMLARIAETVAWLTWHELRTAVVNAQIDLAALPVGVAGTVQRLRDDLVKAIDWHSLR